MYGNSSAGTCLMSLWTKVVDKKAVSKHKTPYEERHMNTPYEEKLYIKSCFE